MSWEWRDSSDLNFLVNVKLTIFFFKFESNTFLQFHCTPLPYKHRALSIQLNPDLANKYLAKPKGAHSEHQWTLCAVDIESPSDWADI